MDLSGHSRGSQEAFRKLLAEAEYPARNPDTNVADIQAQIASNNKGITELRKMVDYYGLPTVQAYMEHVQVCALSRPYNRRPGACEMK
jgi:5-oxoprolinase (ATP-hydrolysing)